MASNCRKYRCDSGSESPSDGRIGRGRPVAVLRRLSEVVCQKVLHGAMTNDDHGDGGHQNTLLPRRHFRNWLFALLRSRGEENKSGVKEKESGSSSLKSREERTIKAAVKDTFVPSLHGLDNGLLLLLPL